MSYTPINWQTGDTITAEKLNKMDPGWGVNKTQILSETVTVEWDSEYNYGYADLAYSGVINSPTLTIIYDNIQYECSAVNDGDSKIYGAQWNDETGYDFSTYPFSLFCGRDMSNGLSTSTNGSHSITVMDNSIEVSDAFSSACNKCVDTSMMPFLCVAGVTTYDEMAAARDRGSLLYFYNDGVCHFIFYFSNSVSATAVSAFPAGSSETYGFNSDMIFTVYYA